MSYGKGLPVGVTKGVPPKNVGPKEKGSKGDGGPVALGLPPDVCRPWTSGLKEGWIDTIPHRFHTKVWNSI